MLLVRTLTTRKGIQSPKRQFAFTAKDTQPMPIDEETEVDLQFVGIPGRRSPDPSSSQQF